MKILIGVDDSPHSQAAVDFVKRMEWPRGSKLIVVAACPPQVIAYSMADASMAGWVESAERERTQEHEVLASRIERQLGSTGLATEARVPHSDPRDALVALALLERADLIVVGSHGRTGLEKLMMGSVASHVVTHAPCSVMVVKLPKGGVVN